VTLDKTTVEKNRREEGSKLTLLFEDKIGVANDVQLPV